MMAVSWYERGFIRFPVDVESDRYAAEGIGVVSGCECTAPGNSTSVSYAAGSVRCGSAVYTISASSVSLTALQHASMTRKALIYVDDDDGLVHAVAGDAEAVAPIGLLGRFTKRPDPPDFTGDMSPGDVVLAEVWLRPTGQLILAADVSDRRHGIRFGESLTLTGDISVHDVTASGIARLPAITGPTTVTGDMDISGEFRLPAITGPTTVTGDMDISGEFQPAKIHGIRYLGGYGFATLNAAVADAPATEALAIFAPSGIYAQPGVRTMLPKDRTTTILGVGAPGQEPDMYNSLGSVIQGGTASGLLYVDSPATSGNTTQVIIKDIEFRPTINGTNKDTVFVNLDGAYIGGVENVVIQNIPAVSGVAHPFNGYGLSMNNGSLGDRYWARDLSISGFGGPTADYGYLLRVGSNHLCMENIHIHGMGQRVMGMYFAAIPGGRSLIKDIQFFAIGDGAGANMHLIRAATLSSAVGVAVQSIEGFQEENCNGASGLAEGIFVYDTKAKFVLDRVALTSTSINYARCNQPSCLLVRGETTRTSTSVSVPIRFVTSFIDSTNLRISPRPVGTATSIILASTSYTCEMRKVMLYVVGGTSVSVTINAVSVPYTAASGSSFILQPGDTINFGNFTGTVTAKAYFLEG